MEKQIQILNLKKLFISLIGIILFFSAPVFAEDSIVAKPKIKPKFVFSFDGRTSVVMDNKAKIGGLKFGLEYKKFRYGLGIYGLNSGIEVTDKIRMEDDTPTKAQVKFDYLSSYVEYVFFQNKRWEFSVPVQFGLGNTHLEYFDSATRKNIIARKIPVSLVEVSVTGHYKFFSWIGLGAGIGYRKMISNRPIIHKAFDSPVFIFKIKIFVGEIYRKIFPKKEKKIIELQIIFPSPHDTMHLRH